MDGTYRVDGSPLTMEELRKVITDLSRIPKNDQWLVVSPEGEMYQGTVEQVLPILVGRHPLFKLPKFPLPFIDPE